MVGPWGTRPTHMYLTRCSRIHELDKNAGTNVSTRSTSTVTGHRSSRFRASKKTTLLQFFSSQIWTRIPCQESLFATAGCKQDVDITHQHVSVKEVKHATICLINLLEIGSFLKFRFLAMHKTLPLGDFQHLSTFISKAGKAWLFCGEASSSEYHRTDVETSAQTTLWIHGIGFDNFNPAWPSPLDYRRLDSAVCFAISYLFGYTCKRRCKWKNIVLLEKPSNNK